MTKVIFIDFSVFMFRAIFSTLHNSMPSTYTCLNMILTCLKKIGIEPDDKIIITLDSKSWRKKISQEYKGERKKKREKFDINWEQEWKNFDWLINILKKTTDWYFLKEDGFECDDLIAIGIRCFKDNECIVVSTDGDLEQLWYYSRVKVFSPMKKIVGVSTKGGYKIKPKNFNLYKFLASKIRKEASDDLVSEITNTEEYDTRMMLVNLIELPSFIEDRGRELYKNMICNECDLESLPFKSLMIKFVDIYNSDKIITYSDSLISDEKKKKRKKRKNLTKRR